MHKHSHSNISIALKSNVAINTSIIKLQTKSWNYIYIYLFERKKKKEEEEKKVDKTWNIIQISTKPHKIPVTLIFCRRKAVRPNRHDIRTMERTVGKGPGVGTCVVESN